jgi:uncharacterized membrane protein
MNQKSHFRGSIPTMTTDGFTGWGSRHLGRLASFLTVSVLGCSALFLAAAPAKADFRLCNKTAGNVGVSIGYKNQNSWVTEGWWNIPAASCEVVVSGPLNSRYFYIYALDYDNGGEWGGQTFMCTRGKEFTIEGTEDCLARGFERTGFFEVDTGEQRNWTVQLTEKPTSGTGGQ